MKVEEVISKIKRASNMVSSLSDGSITFTIDPDVSFDAGDIVDVLEEYIYMLNNMEVKKQ